MRPREMELLNDPAICSPFLDTATIPPRHNNGSENRRPVPSSSTTATTRDGPCPLRELQVRCRRRRPQRQPPTSTYERRLPLPTRCKRQVHRRRLLRLVINQLLGNIDNSPDPPPREALEIPRVLLVANVEARDDLDGTLGVRASPSARSEGPCICGVALVRREEGD